MLLFLAAVWAFVWPGWDAVWPNVVASILWATPAFVAHHWLMRRAHARALAQHLDDIRDELSTYTTEAANHRSALVGAIADAMVARTRAATSARAAAATAPTAPTPKRAPRRKAPTAE
jgi:F0F1-type ATP synthase membrane subunit b/b'